MSLSGGPQTRRGAAEGALPDTVLARIRFGTQAAGDDPREACVPLSPIDADFAELWLAQAPVSGGQDGAIAYSCDGHTLFGQLQLSGDEARDIERAAERAYRELLRVTRARGYPHLLRAWNYFDGVTQGEGDAERYRRFCVGRRRAIDAPGYETSLPAATVIGASLPGLWLCFFASKSPGAAVENPRQTSAYRYPRQYGPASPSFARAMRIGPGLLVSGTAAIVGHETRHRGDVARQAEEMLANVRALLARAEADGSSPLRASLLRLYVRRRDDAAQVAAIVRAVLGADAALAVLHGEICREDLLTEIEGVFTPA